MFRSPPQVLIPGVMVCAVPYSTASVFLYLTVSVIVFLLLQVEKEILVVLLKYVPSLSSSPSEEERSLRHLVNFGAA